MSDDEPVSEARVEITTDPVGDLIISDRVDGEMVPRPNDWLATYALAKVDGRRVPTCRVCGQLTPADLELHAAKHVEDRG